MAPLAASDKPSFRAPVPQSKMSSVPSSVTASMHGVLPPKRIVSGPAAAMEPRVPQKRRRMSASRGREDGELGGEIAHHLGSGVLGAEDDQWTPTITGFIEHRVKGTTRSGRRSSNLVT